MGLVSNGLSEGTRCKCRLSGEEDEELAKEDLGQRVPGRGKSKYLYLLKGRGSLEAGGWPAGLGLGAKEWDSASLGEIFLGLLLHVRSSDFIPGESTGVVCHFLLQRIFPTQGLNLGHLHCRQTLYHLSHKGSPGEGGVQAKVGQSH